VRGELPGWKKELRKNNKTMREEEKPLVAVKQKKEEGSIQRS